MLQFHILNPFFNAFGGSELGALEIYRGIAGHCEAALWSERVPDPRPGDLPIRRIFQPGAWLEAGRPDLMSLVLKGSAFSPPCSPRAGEMRRAEITLMLSPARPK